MSNELPVRKNIRLKEYVYSAAGYYFVTICIKDKHEMLGRIIVGDAPLRVPCCELSEYGVFADAQIQKINHIYPCVSVDKYVIMPNHIHMIAVVNDRVNSEESGTNNKESGTRGGASPTKAVIPQIVQSMKSMTTKQFGFSLWQRSFHDHIIRDEADYQRIWQYIDENPARWAEDEYFI